MLGKIIALVEQHTMLLRSRPALGVRHDRIDALPIHVKRQQEYYSAVFRDGVVIGRAFRGKAKKRREQFDEGNVVRRARSADRSQAFLIDPQSLPVDGRQQSRAQCVRQTGFPLIRHRESVGVDRDLFDDAAQRSNIDIVECRGE